MYCIFSATWLGGVSMILISPRRHYSDIHYFICCDGGQRPLYCRSVSEAPWTCYYPSDLATHPSPCTRLAPAE